ncbi:hypothetical protein GCM10009104_02080 [Marinobacterium maritimum]|uniref:PilZ domain-containing protein n=1 Tax=Marinobacterium maritimum TaxID=500162 RepID=A0ABP3TBP1_9GAMM
MIGPQRYLQHPEQIELELSPLLKAPAASSSSIPLGLLLHCHHYYPSGKWLRIQAPALTEELSIDARVVDCDRGQQGDYLLKLAFPDQEQMFRARMLEQLCQICIYQRHDPDKDLNQQALEWIEAEAAHFPSNGL